MTIALDTLSLVVITDLYNLVAEKPVKKFESKAKGVARLTAVLEATGQEVVAFDDADYDVRPIAPPVEEKAEAVVLTDLEYAMMETIAHAEHNPTNGATPEKREDVNTWLWADEFGKAIGIGEKAAGGVLSSLSQKGLIEMDVSGKKADHSVWFTDAGFTTWQLEHQAGRVYEAPKAGKGKKAKKAAGGKRGPAPEFADELKITEVVANPKREGTAAHTRYALYTAGMTVGAYLAAGGTRSDLAWDSERKFIKIGK